jgi:hypothetical protein
VELLRRQALRLCALEYFQECQDALDRAKAIDPAGDADPTVTQARELIAGDTAHGSPGVLPSFYFQAKPGAAPDDRRLQRHP